MDPGLLTVSVVALFVAGIVARCVVLIRGRRLRFSPNADRTEKNRHHLATAVVAAVCLALAWAGLQVPALHHPVLWVTVGFMLLFVLPMRILLTELGVRRRGRTTQEAG